MAKKPVDYSGETRYSAPDFDPHWDLTVSSADDPPPDGRPLTIRTIEQADGSTAQVPDRLYIRVAPDTTAETRAERLSPAVVMGEEIPRWKVTAFQQGRQVVIDADVDESGNVEMRAVTVYRPDGPLSPLDVTAGLRIHEWLLEGLAQAVAYETAIKEAEEGRYHRYLWPESELVGRGVAERIRHRPPIGRGRPPAPAEMRKRAYQLSDEEGLTSKFIALRLTQEFPDESPRSDRTIRTWLRDRARRSTNE